MSQLSEANSALFDIITHPLAQHKLAYIRDEQCSMSRFRQITKELGSILAFEALRNRGSNYAEIRTPVFKDQPFRAYTLADKIVLIAILRSGGALVEGGLDMIPNARVGHIYLERDQNDYSVLNSKLVSIPNAEGQFFIVMDMVIGTGGTACAALDILVNSGISQDMICMASLIAAPEGLNLIMRRHSGITITTLAVDEGIDKDHHVKPGLGDTARRLYGA